MELRLFVTFSRSDGGAERSGILDGGKWEVTSTFLFCGLHDRLQRQKFGVQVRIILFDYSFTF
jgi:hypothetical protein